MFEYLFLNKPLSNSNAEYKTSIFGIVKNIVESNVSNADSNLRDLDFAVWMIL